MRACRLRLPDGVADLIRGLHPDIKRQLRLALDRLTHSPLEGKELKGDLAGLRSLRVGRFRIVYRIAPERILEIVAVGPRMVIYEETLRLVRREAGAPSRHRRGPR